jgi:DNA (cytosine-5)-methyltransferase 1
MAGSFVVGASEIDEWACDTFSYNHPSAVILKGDIRQKSDTEITSPFKSSPIDILLGGPPCQGFSVANIRSGDPTDPRNSLFEEFIRLGKLFKPSVMIMENVPNIVNAHTHEGKLVVDIINQELRKLEYNVYSTILQASDYGVPQIRKRFVVIASKKALDEPFPKPTHSLNGKNLFGLHPVPTLWDAISDLPPLKAGEELHIYAKPPQSEYQSTMRSGSESLHNHIAMRHTPRLIERFKVMTWGQKGDQLPDAHMPNKRNGNGIKSINGYSQNNRRMFPNRPSHTLAASFYANFVHPYEHRNFTPREGARIQSFPDTYIFKGKPTVVSQKLLEREGRSSEKHLCQYNQIGNAVPPLMAKAIAENIMQQL